MRHLMIPLSLLATVLACSGPPTGSHIDLAVGPTTTCALQAPSDVYCWGPLGSTTMPIGSNSPTLVSGLSDVAQVAVGADHACVRQSSGSVACWGGNGNGQLGDSGAQRATPNGTVSGVQSIVQVAAGNGFSCALSQGGTVSCWGENTYGELGDGTTTSRSTPASVVRLPSGIVEIAAAGDADHACARTSDGAVLCWGWDAGGGVSGTLTSSARVSTPLMVPSLTGAVQIVVGGQGSCARLMSGMVSCWGALSFQSSMGSGPPVVQGLTDAVEIAAGAEHMCARQASGSVVCLGQNGSGQLGNPADGSYVNTPTAVAGLTDAQELAAGRNSTCVRRALGAVECWGQDSLGMMATPTAVTLPQ